MGFQVDTLQSSTSSVVTGPDDWLVGGGEMGKLIRSMDWSKTPLGPIQGWPQSLRTTVSLCLASNFPISLTWGPHHIQIYNDGYWPICGGKHPKSMGQSFPECWAAPWAVIGNAFERAWGGETSFLEDQRMFLDRNGYLEETFFTFSFSPVRDESGGIGGLFHPVTETTSKMIGERRTRALRDLVAHAGEAKTVEEACRLAAQTLAEYQLDVPFGIFYMFDATGKEARRTACTGFTAHSNASVESVNVERHRKQSWPLHEVFQSPEKLHISDVQAQFGHFSCGPYEESVKEAMALPILPPGCEHPVGVLIAGVSSRLELNETYQAFYDLLESAVTAAVTSARAYEEERKRARALAEIDRAKTEFFSNVSHEFRTPLTLMLGSLEDELAERAEPLPKARRERLETAHRNSLRLLKLVNALLDFSRIEAGRVQANYEPTDLAKLTTELASVFQSAVERAGLSFEVDCAPLSELAHVDREMWEKIVLNLLSNALKHTFAGAIRVNLSLSSDAKYAELTVADRGIGIASSEVAHLFERFHRVKGAKSRTHEGTGIGLALVQELALLHGGAVRVESEEGRGTTFVVTLKLGNEHLPPERVVAKRELRSTSDRAIAFVEEAMQWLPSPSNDAEPSAVAAPIESMKREKQRIDMEPVRRPRILWADDNADMRDYVGRLLAENYEVIGVSDGLTARVLAQQDPPDLILSDVMMPGLDGFGLLREIRNDPRTKTVPVILLSARAGEESAVEGLDAGADDYLAKPFSARELLARVRTHLELARVRKAWTQELEEANKELEAFSYSVSHDLRAPLRAIDGFSRIVLDDYGTRLDTDGRQYLERIRSNAQRMSTLIDGLLSLAHITKGTLKKESIDLTKIARAVVADLQVKDSERHVAVDIPDGLTAVGDTGLIAAVIANLVGNAWKFTSKKDDARVTVGMQQKENKSVFFVRDNGAGFDMAYSNKLFEPFKRLHTKSEFEGTGIGLATVQRIVARHKGQIWAESEVGQGATFYFTLGDPQR